MNRYSQEVQNLKGEIVDVGFGSHLNHLSESDLQGVEHLLGFSLPPDYREFLCDFGGISFLYGATFSF